MLNATRRIAGDLAHATAFLTRLPVPAILFAGTPLDFARQGWAFPVVGALVGLVAGLVASLALFATGNAPIAAVTAVAASVIVTGALHEDGLADVADGFWGGHEPARRLAIMRDSAVGTYGVAALVVAVALKVTAIVPLLALSPGAFCLVLATAGALGRHELLTHWLVLPPAPRPDGNGKPSLAARFGRPGRDQMALAFALTLALVATLLLAVPAVTVLPALVLAALATGTVTLVSLRKIGGHTGDTLGATAVLAELAFLSGALAPTSWP